LTYGPFVGIYFVCYELGKKYFSAWQGVEPDKMHLSLQLFCGGVSGAIAAGVTCPLDVIKTRIQVQSKASATRYAGFTAAWNDIVYKEGYR